MCRVCVLWSADLPTVCLQSSWESIQGCLFPAVTFPAVSSAIAMFGDTNTNYCVLHAKCAAEST